MTRNKYFSGSFRYRFRGITVLAALLFTGCNKNGNTLKPELKPITEAVYASGHVVSEQEYQVFAQTEGILAEKKVDEGASVAKDQVLFVLESPQQSARLQFAQEAYAVAARNYRNQGPALREAQAGLEAARTRLAFDSTNYIRYQNLLQHRATSKAEFENFKLTYENSRSDYQAQKSRLANLKNQLFLDLQNAESNLKVARDETSRSEIKSDINGVLLKTLKEPGELVNRGEVLGIVGQLGSFYLKLSVDELDVNRVKTGQQTLVKIDAFPNKIFRARISKIYPIVDPRDQSLRVDAQLLDKLPGYYSGLALEANIIIRKKEQALVIPRTVLLPGDSVEIKKGRDEQKVKIRKGVETLSEVEVLAGLDKDTEIVKP
ncbi:efflux RND transporter periplasmic adaptor subunit [Adhaeribacter soli]|uniref:HlyD family efflux transporter periplasmic adaptor subunit n=1 Tax=Adhaeribacter soli TaxID=2607655 RepID=A0A5N1IWU6_9BACT|nr:efflux RND transporter periplasmic adaptor subunit [Adhaeribacter soli]KAA9333626.1 HlyD family efflux transporter periplasmic adaptor subunit [Adhaeribacter soli]